MSGESDTFVSGDLVMLRSGGPHMTVSHLRDRSVTVSFAHCKWFDESRLCGGEFRVEMLRKVSGS